MQLEIELRRSMASEFESNLEPFPDIPVNQYIDQIGQRITKNSGLKIPLIMNVVQSDEIDAVALPGG